MKEQTNEAGEVAVEEAAETTARIDFVAAVDAGTMYVSEDLVTRQVPLGNGDVADVCIAELADKKVRDILRNPKGYDRAELIAAAIRRPDGKPLLTRDAAGKLKLPIAKALEAEAMKVCGVSNDAAEEAGND